MYSTMHVVDTAVADMSAGDLFFYGTITNISVFEFSPGQLKLHSQVGDLFLDGNISGAMESGTSTPVSTAETLYFFDHVEGPTTFYWAISTNQAIFGVDFQTPNVLLSNDDPGGTSETIAQILASRPIDLVSTAHLVIYGGGGDDFLNLPGGGGFAYGHGGDDSLTGGDGNDGFQGNAGKDVITGNGGNDSAGGHEGIDTMYGGAGIDQLNGGPDNDTIFGGSEGDYLSGDDGDDTIYGGSGNDQIAAAGFFFFTGTISLDGNPVPGGGDGNDLIEGGPGTDTAIFVGNASEYVITKSGDETTVSARGWIDTLRNVEFFQFDDIKIDAAQHLFTDESDTVNFRDLALAAVAGGPELYAALGGNDVVTLPNKLTAIPGYAESNLFSGGAGNDTITGGTRDDKIDGGAGNDLIVASSGVDHLFGSVTCH